MNALSKGILIAATTLVVTGTAASAAVVCNREGDCWHVRGDVRYEPRLGLRVYGDDWRWRERDHYRWREHEGRGYWRNGAWIEIR